MKSLAHCFIRYLFLLALCTAGLLTLANAAQSNQLKGIRAWPSPDNTRVVLDLASKPKYNVHYLKHPDRLVLDLKSTSSKVNLKKIVNNGPLVKNLRESASGQKNTFRLVIDLKRASKAKVFSLAPAKPYGHRLVIDLPHSAKKKVVTPKKQQAIPATGRDIMIAIDAGHGGDDPGALGKYTYEKKVTLEIAKRLRNKINQQKGMHAFLIRTGDYFVNLNKRTAIARKHKADFLVSIHADGFTSSRPHGASVWVLSNRRATTELGRWMEKHEVHSELLGGAGDLIEDSSSVPFLTEMFLDMSMGNAMDVGYNIGDLVVKELKQVTKLHKKKPVHASLAVLKSPDIPSILVEAGFITNRAEEKLLNKPSHQNKIANAVFTGIYKHFLESPPQGTLFAQKKRAIQHTVRSGESLSGLAVRYSISAANLKAYNNLKSSSLRIGQVIKIPANYQLVLKRDPVRQSTVSFQKERVQKERIHKVTRGESLSLIAKRYATTSKKLKSYNKLRSTSLAIGQKIKIPGNYAAVVQRPKTYSRREKPAKPLVHQVKRGESLSLIAQRYATTTNKLKAYNSLRSTSLAVGQKIKIPGSRAGVVQRTAIKARTHKVKRGESLSVIAQRYGKTSRELQSYNKLRSTSLMVGQKIKIPGSHADVVQRTAIKARTHKVKRGESLSVIAQRYGKTSRELQTYNKLRSTSLMVGQKIKIPGYQENRNARTVNAKPIIHKVKRGESLSVIAKRYGSSTSTLKKYNKLRSTSLAVGQKIRIPTAVAQLKKHKVRSGESLSVIANRYGTTTSALKSFNKLHSSLLAVGQVLTIPVT